MSNLSDHIIAAIENAVTPLSSSEIRDIVLGSSYSSDAETDLYIELYRLLQKKILMEIRDSEDIKWTTTNRFERELREIVDELMKLWMD